MKPEDSHYRPLALSFDEIQSLVYARLVATQKRYLDSKPGEVLAQLKRLVELQERAVDVSATMAAGHAPASPKSDAGLIGKRISTASKLGAGGGR